MCGRYRGGGVDCLSDVCKRAQILHSGLPDHLKRCVLVYGRWGAVVWLLLCVRAINPGVS